MNDITKIIKSLEDSDVNDITIVLVVLIASIVLIVLTDGVTETVKDEIKTQEGAFLRALLAPLAASLVQPVFSSVIKGISGRGVGKAGRGYMVKIF